MRDRKTSSRSFVRVNLKIRVPQVRCVGSDGEMLGVMKTSEAMRLASAAGQDLVEISPAAEPPVCRIMDFGQYRYNESNLINMKEGIMMNQSSALQLPFWKKTHRLPGIIGT